MAKKKVRKKKSVAKKRRKVSGKKAVKKKRAVRKKARAKRPPKKAVKVPKGPKLPTEPIGRVTHYFPKARATAVMIEREGIQGGDTLYFKGHTTSFKQRVQSLQINRQAVPQASPGEEVGIQVSRRTREHDRVFKLPS